jgi:hypothetical protein
MRHLLPLLLIALVGCEASPPRLVEARTPSDTRDTAGPYRVTMVLGGQVASAKVLWQNPQNTYHSIPMRQQSGDIWQADLPGRAAGSRIALELEASGPSGLLTIADPSWSFRILHDEGPCLVDGDCLPTEICDRLRHACHVPPEACADDGDCAQDYLCADRTCRFRPSTCDGDAACGPGLMCEAGLCVSRPECADDADCPGGRCLVPPGRCIRDVECILDGDCPADRPRCEANACVPALPPCGGPCPEGTRCIDDICTPDAGPCADCPRDAARCHPTEDRCVQCFADGHCGPDSHCDLGSATCQPRPRRRICLDCSQGCGAGQRCGFDAPGLCLPDCANGERCPAGFECDSSTCQPFDFCLGQDCRADADCDSGVCQAGLCEPTQHCTRNEDCANDRRCTDGTCRVLEPFCTQGSDCPPGTGCLAGRCVPTNTDALCDVCPNPACTNAGLCVPFDGPNPICLPACGRSSDCPGNAQCEEVGGGMSLCLPNSCEPVADCRPDAYEPNDNTRQATPLSPFENLISATACPGDLDIYRTPNLPGQLDFFVANATVTLGLLYADGRVDNHTVRPFDGTSLQFSPDLQYITVESDGGDDPTYDLFAFFEAEPQPCDDDLLEPNDDPERATNVRFGASINAMLCPGDADWYELRLRPGERAQVSVFPTGFEGLWITGIGLEGELLFEEAVMGGEQSVHRFSAGRMRDSQFLVIDCLECASGAPYRLGVAPD